MPNLQAMQQRAHAALRRWNGGKPGYLVRNGVKRPATIARGEYSPRERELFLDGSERFLIAAYKLQVPPDHEQDMILFNGKNYRITAPVKGPRPDGTVMLYDCPCLYDSEAT